MKKMLVLLAVLLSYTGLSYAIGRDGTRSVSDFTGDNVGFSLVSVSSATVATTLAGYSTSRGALTIINVSTNTVNLSTSPTVGNYISLPAGYSLQFKNNAALYGQVGAGIAVMSVDVITEW